MLDGIEESCDGSYGAEHPEKVWQLDIGPSVSTLLVPHQAFHAIFFLIVFLVNVVLYVLNIFEVLILMTKPLNQQIISFVKD